MLLQRIRLKGFLGHRGLSDMNGGDGFVDIDLRSSPLWLIHGPNGGGKSSLWDAVTFTLFKKHRASETKNNRLAQLVHDMADEAIVELEFELRGQQYRIRSKISKIKRRTKKSGAESKSPKIRDDVKTWNIVELWEEDDWKSIPDTEGKADEWVERNIGISYETFVCAVLLRQGEADAFIKAKPAQRKSRLLELLQLEFYEELGRKANAERTKWSGKRDVLEEALIRLLRPDGEKAENRDNLKGEIARLFHLIEERVGIQRRLIVEAQDNSGRAAANLNTKERELNDAQQVEYLLKQIESVHERQRTDAALIEQAATIKENAHQYRELKEVSRILDDLWEARCQLSKESQELTASTKKIADMGESQRALTESFQQRRLDEEKAGEAFREASARLEQALEQQRTAKDQAAKLEELEQLEKEMQEAEEELKPYQETLQQRNRIKQDYDRHTELSQVLRLLKDLADAVQQLEDVRRQHESQQAELGRREVKAQHDRDEEERLRQVEQTLSLECDGLRQEVSSQATELTRVRDKIEARNSVSGEEECPTCGSTLDEVARVRIQHEREHWAEETAQLESESKRLNRLLEEKTEALERARSEVSTASDAALTSRLKVERARSDFDHAASDVTRAEGFVEDARLRAGDWAKELTHFSALTEEFDSLLDVPEDWKQLLEAQEVENKVQSEVKAHRKQLKRLPQWSADERVQVRVAAENLAQKVAACTDEKATTWVTLEAAQANRSKIEKEQLQLDVELRTERERANDLTRRRHDAQTRYENKQSELPPKWVDDPACVDKAALDELNRKLRGLHDAENKERELGEAHSRQKEIEGSLKILQAQLEEIPSAHRRDVAEVQHERDVAKADEKRAQEEFRRANEEMVKLEEQKRVADGRREEFIEAEREFGYFKLLAEAFGPSGLRARVVQSAQEMIKSHANTILSRLSNGEWQVELQDVSETELEIQARNLMQPGAQPRPFEYLSGGEKFRVAISLAVAIGQSVLGERIVDTLVIDEGFGSLDEINRDLMAKEMTHLSEEVLRGGRIVVVSHLDDVRGDFGNRYRISKSSEGYIKVERNGQN